MAVTKFSTDMGCLLCDCERFNYIDEHHEFILAGDLSGLSVLKL